MNPYFVTILLKADEQYVYVVRFEKSVDGTQIYAWNKSFFRN